MEKQDDRFNFRTSGAYSALTVKYQMKRMVDGSYF